MKKFLSLVLAFSFSLSAFASSGSVQGLDQLLNEYEYSMALEWDQKDLRARSEIVNRMSADLKALMASEQVSKQDLISVIQKRVKSKNNLEALKLKASLLPENLSQEQQLETLLQSLNSGAQGASWNSRTGTIAVVSIVGLYLAAMVLVVANQLQQGECVEYGTEMREYCNDSSEFSSGTCYMRYPCLKRENESWF